MRPGKPANKQKLPKQDALVSYIALAKGLRGASLDALERICTLRCKREAVNSSAYTTVAIDNVSEGASKCTPRKSQFTLIESICCKKRAGHHRHQIIQQRCPNPWQRQRSN